MMNDKMSSKSASRRQFLFASTALASTAAFTAGTSAAQPPIRFRRKNLTDPEAARDVDSYERAVTAMLKLPPSDPRNWFRLAVTHLLDCPHGSWWFLPWHRGYLGWFELICRDLSGDPQFALPYWDWTLEPRLPQRFLTGNLNPANFSIKGLAQFKVEFTEPLADLWDSFTADQLSQLKLRGITSLSDVWKQVEGKWDPMDTAPLFPDPADARALNPPRTQEFDEVTYRAVSLSTVLDALAPRDFLTFGSGKQPNHHEPLSGRPEFGVLEGQPHNRVHNTVGGYVTGNPSRQGFMSAFLSPSDPIFYLHHTNIDRLWDVWTRKQVARRPAGTAEYPIAPQGPDLAVWNDERFLFFVGPDGQPTAKQRSGDYVSVDAFNYRYQAGSGEIVVPTVAPPAPLAMRSFSTELKGMRASADVPADTTKTAGEATGTRVVATITVELPADAHDVILHVVLNAKPNARSIAFHDPGYAGSFELFGAHHSAPDTHKPQIVTFSVGITGAIERLRVASRLPADQPLQVQVVPTLRGLTLEPLTVKVTEVVINTL
jgi:tyrosinase